MRCHRPSWFLARGGGGGEHAGTGLPLRGLNAAAPLSARDSSNLRYPWVFRPGDRTVAAGGGAPPSHARVDEASRCAARLNGPVDRPVGGRTVRARHGNRVISIGCLREPASARTLLLRGACDANSATQGRAACGAGRGPRVAGERIGRLGPARGAGRAVGTGMSRVGCQPRERDVPDGLVGRVFSERYQLEATIGRGATSRVYRALDLALRRGVAVKVMRRDLAADPARARRFERHVRTCALLRHPNTVRTLDFGLSEEGWPYAVMELLQGRLVASVLADEGPLPPGRAMAVAAQVARALGEAHAFGIVHGDLGAGHVLLTWPHGGTDCAKVIGFGAGWRAELAGGGLPDAAPACGAEDCRALGRLLFEMLTGAPALPRAAAAGGNGVGADGVGADGAGPRSVPALPPVIRGRPVPDALRALVADLLCARASDGAQSALELAEPRERLAAALRPHLRTGGVAARAVALPAVLGLLRSRLVQADLEERLGVPLFELPTLPTSVPGLRLDAALEEALAAAGVKRLHQWRALALTPVEGGLLVGVGREAVRHTIRARSVVLATGRFAGRGLVACRHRIREPLLDLPVDQPDGRDDWHSSDFLDPAGHPVNRAGLRTDAAFRPLGPDGGPAHERLHAVGSILAHQDWVRSKSGAALACGTAWAAVAALADGLAGGRGADPGRASAPGVGG